MSEPVSTEWDPRVKQERGFDLEATGCMEMSQGVVNTPKAKAIPLPNFAAGEQSSPGMGKLDGACSVVQCSDDRCFDVRSSQLAAR